MSLTMSHIFQFQFAAVVGFCLLTMAGGMADTLSEREAVLDQESIACQLEKNTTLSYEYHESIQQINNETVLKKFRTFAVSIHESGGFNCFSQQDCPGAITWCFNLYHPSKHIEVCIDESNQVVRETKHAQLLSLASHFTVGTDCEYNPGPCIHLTSAPYYFNGGLLTCSSNSESCSSHDYVRVQVMATANGNNPPRLSFRNTSTDLVLTEKNIYYFTADIPETPFLSFYTYTGIIINGRQMNSIPQSHLCEYMDIRECQLADNYNDLKENRIRVYSIREHLKQCPQDLIRDHTWLVIDNATMEDAYLNITYQGSYATFFGIPTSAYLLNLTAVPPLSSVTGLQFPAGNVTQQQLGTSVDWHVSVQAGLGDEIIWKRNGVPVMFFNSPNISHDEACLLSNGSFYTTSFIRVSTFVLNHSSLLHLCNLTSEHAAQYDCVLRRQRGEDREINLWTVNLEVQTPGSHGDVLILSVVHVAIGLIVALLLILVIVATVLMAACIRVTKQNKKFKSRPSRRGTTVIHIENGASNTGMGVAWNISEQGFGTTSDEFEFPRERLVLMDKILGKGTFGIVLLARAEGIVRDSPDRNIVAVKKQQESTQVYEEDCLWEELLVMKDIKPHPHIVNLLGYCRPTTSSPLYLILEFAAHGNLHSFLKECNKTILGENQTYIAEGHYQSSTSLTDSCAYLNIQDDDFTTANPDISHYVDSKYSGNKATLSMDDVHNFASQIASGLSHLHREKIVHCDLATRNVLIAEGFLLKIGDFGMARKMEDKDYCRRTEGHVPVKWTAPEALEEQIFTLKSDIWSYAVTLWEILSYGQQPYSDMKIGQSWDPFIQSLKEGRRLSIPKGCPQPLYDLMLKCWSLNLEQRPSAKEVFEFLENRSEAVPTGNSSAISLANTSSEDEEYLTVCLDGPLEQENRPAQQTQV